ncbi:MAG: hypothetical protein LBQ10_00240 [Desulfovibrio sp.]|nr:hypothetical protein [Desulfovibrio sp.]
MEAVAVKAAADSVKTGTVQQLRTLADTLLLEKRFPKLKKIFSRAMEILKKRTGQPLTGALNDYIKIGLFSRMQQGDDIPQRLRERHPHDAFVLAAGSSVENNANFMRFFFQQPAQFFDFYVVKEKGVRGKLQAFYRAGGPDGFRPFKNGGIGKRFVFQIQANAVQYQRGQSRKNRPEYNIAHVSVAV